MSLIKKQAGFAMVEVMVTVAIITIGVSGMGMLLVRAIQGTQDSSQQSQAMWIVQDFVGRMRANPDGARADMYNLVPAGVSCDTQPAQMCAETFTGINPSSTESPAVSCSPTQMATFDKWISTCGLSDTVYDAPSDFVGNPELTSTCLSYLNTRMNKISNSADCVQYQVELSWDTKITKGSPDQTERINTNTYSMIVEFN